MGDPYLEDYRHGSCEPWTVDLICALVRAHQSHLIIETGTFETRTTRRLFETLETMPYSGVLLTVESDPERAARCQAIIHGWQTTSHSGVSLVVGEALQFLKDAPTETADMIFLDDDHEPSHVLEEGVEALRVLRHGGLLLIHDVIGMFGLGEVCRKLGGVIIEMPRLHVSGGLGIVSK